jgi:hypothetical protein
MPRNDGTSFRLIITVVITLICLGISFIQMARGFKEFGGSFMDGYFFSGVFSFVIILILFYLIFELSKARKENKSVWGIMAWYLFFVLLSFAGNFNSFYSLFMKNELLKDELNEKYLSLRQLKADAQSLLLPQVLEDKLKELDSQITSPSEPGCSNKCKDILNQIKTDEAIKAIKGPIEFQEIIRGRNESPSDYSKRYRKLIVGESADELIETMKKAHLPFQDKVNRALKYPENTAEDSDEKLVPYTIKEIINRYNQDAPEVKRISKDKYKGETTLTFDNADLGKISQTFNSASHHLRHWGTWISAFAALMIDLFVPLFILGFATSGQKQAFTFGKRGAKNLT